MKGTSSVDLNDSYGKIITSVCSRTITVFRPKDFPGVFKTSELSKALAREGLRITINTGRRRKQDSVSLFPETDNNTEAIIEDSENLEKNIQIDNEETLNKD
ncbi:hypothetical protein HK096_006351 [Nowakowskiella sp. JEL0078]|nr:hypothetical protein HK096_006351 [Nowakowskiella sp. JEL0078]